MARSNFYRAKFLLLVLSLPAPPPPCHYLLTATKWHQELELGVVLSEITPLDIMLLNLAWYFFSVSRLRVLLVTY
jgi:hypothetical protein